VKVLVTGASGFIGRHCLPVLAERGYEIHAVFKDRSLEAPANVQWHRADLLDHKDVRDLIAHVRPTHLLHLAWYAKPGKFWTSTENFRWVAASLELFEQFGVAGGQRLVAAGTCVEYSCQDVSALHEDVSPTAPTTLYGACKHALHIMLEAFARQSGLSYAWGRVFFPYGPHEYPERLVAYAVRSMLTRNPVNCTHGRQLRDFMYVEDVAKAFVSLLDSQVNGPINIGSGHAVTLKKVIETVAEKLGTHNLIRLGAIAARPDEPQAVVADVTRLHDELGFAPSYTLDRGIEATIDWWKQQLDG
jgi:nucleoside-diphosphate-sugar epimerase